MGTDKVKEIELEVDYESALNRNFRGNVQDAVKFYLSIDDDYKYAGGSEQERMYATISHGFILYPQALNPFLRIMETLKETRNIVILPSFNNDNYGSSDDVNAPAYLILKVGRSGFVTKLVTSG